MKKNLAKIIISSIIAAVVLPLIIIGIINISLSTNFLRLEINKKNTVLIKSLKNQIDHYFEIKLNDIYLLKEIIEKDSGNPALIQFHIDTLIEHQSQLLQIENIKIINKRGIVTAVSPKSLDVLHSDQSRQKYFIEPLKTNKPYYSSSLISPQLNKPIVIFSIPYKDGVISFSLALEDFNKFIADINIELKSQIALVDNTGTYIAHSHTKKALQRDVDNNYKSLKKDYKGNQIVRKLMYDDTSMICYMMMIKKTDWAIIIYESLDELYAPVLRLYLILALGTIAVILIVLLLFTRQIRRIFHNLKEFIERIKKISMGDYDKFVEIPGYEEFDEVANAFNLMMVNIRDREEKINNSLKEKEILLKEVHHRVKNNMQIISSLFNLQSTNIENDEERFQYEKSSSRVKAMALVYENIYQSEDFTHIAFPKYIANLFDSLIGLFNKFDKVTFENRVDDININLNQAIPCGLILNELLMNSMKHGFPNSATGVIIIDFQLRDHVVYIEYSDNGIGFADDIDFESADTLGFTLIKSLVNQLKGTIEFNSNEGIKINIEFPLL